MRANGWRKGGAGRERKGWSRFPISLPVFLAFFPFAEGVYEEEEKFQSQVQMAQHPCMHGVVGSRASTL